MSGPGFAERLAWVGLGSALGGLARFGLGALGGGLFAVFLANALGAFAVGLYATLCRPGGALAAGPRQRLFVVPGVLAGLTSFSMFSLRADGLMSESLLASAGFVLASLASWVFGVWSGEGLAVRLADGTRSVG